MQTQSISLVTTAVSQNVSTKTTKANGDTFERFMSDHGTKLTEKKGQTQTQLTQTGQTRMMSDVI